MSFGMNLKWMTRGITINAKSVARPLTFKTQILLFGLIFCMPFIYPYLRSNLIKIQRALRSTMAGASSVQSLPSQYSVAFVTAPSEAVAKELSRGLVKEKLAACVNIVPKITSIYEWKGEINEDNEVLMIIKTRTSSVHEMTDFVKNNHPYEVCEVISTEIKQGNQQYLDWIGEVVAPRK